MWCVSSWLEIIVPTIDFTWAGNVRKVASWCQQSYRYKKAKLDDLAKAQLDLVPKWLHRKMVMSTPITFNNAKVTLLILAKQHSNWKQQYFYYIQAYFYRKQNQRN